MAEYKSIYTGEQIDGGIAKAYTALQEHQDITGKQDVLVSGENIKTINNQSVLGSGNLDIQVQENFTIKNIDVADPTQFDGQKPTQLVLEDVIANHYKALRIYNIPISEDVTIEIYYHLIAELSSENYNLRKFVYFDESNEDVGTCITAITISKQGENQVVFEEQNYPLGSSSGQ